MIPLPMRLILALTMFAVFISGILVFGQRRFDKGVAVTTEHYELVLKKQEAEAAQILLAETERVRAAEQALDDFKTKQELKDATNTKLISSLSARLRDLAGPAGRLRDPNAAGCGQDSGSAAESHTAPADAGPADPGEGGGLLSEELSGLLRRLTLEADEINAAYASCRGWVREVTGPNPW